MIPMPPQSLPGLLRDLITAKYGARGRSAFARDAGVHHTTISRILAGSLVPTPDTLTVLAHALGGTDVERADLLTRLRQAAGLAAVEPPPLRWPAGVDRLTPRQRRGVQRTLNVMVAAFLEEEPPAGEELAEGIEITESAPIPAPVEGGDGQRRRVPARRG